MRVSTSVMLLGAAVCAAAAALLTQAWLGGRSEASPPTVVRAAAPEMRPVIVAAAPLKFGTVLSPDMLSEVPWPAAYFPPDAFENRDALLTGGQRIVLASMAKNEPILASKITGPGQRASLSIMIDEGKKAVTIRVDDVLGVAGFVQPDDRVDVLLTRNDRAATGAGTTGGAYTDLLLQNVRVLAIDQLAERNTQAKPVKAVTVEVDTDEAQKLVLAASVGQLSLALRRAGWMQTSSSRRIGLQDLPSSPQTPQTAPVEEERGPLVTIIRGAGESKQYNLNPEAAGSSTGAPILERSTLKSAEARPDQDTRTEPAMQSEPR